MKVKHIMIKSNISGEEIRDKINKNNIIYATEVSDRVHTLLSVWYVEDNL